MPVSPGRMPGRMISVDPGDRHVGWCEWLNGVPVTMIEHDPKSALKRLETVVDRLDLLVYERFLLYGWLAAQQVGSEFLTAQLIGAIKWECDKHGVPVVGQTASQAKSLYKIKPYVNWKPREWPTYGKGNHVKDAFIHGAYLLRERGLTPGKPS
jgi:hypothetical protein